MCMFAYHGFIAFIIVFGGICHHGDINFQDCNCYSRCGFTLLTWSLLRWRGWVGLFFFVVSSCSRHHLITDWSQSNTCFNKVSIHQRLSEWNIMEEAVSTKTLCLKRQIRARLGKQRLNWEILFHVKHYTVHVLITRAYFNTNSKLSVPAVLTYCTLTDVMGNFWTPGLYQCPKITVILNVKLL